MTTSRNLIPAQPNTTVCVRRSELDVRSFHVLGYTYEPGYPRGRVLILTETGPKWLDEVGGSATFSVDGYGLDQ